MKISQKSKLELSDIEVPDLFVLNYMSSLEGTDVKLYLYLNFIAKRGLEIENAALAKRLGITEQELGFSLDRLQVEGLVIKNTHGYSLADLKEVEINKSYIPKMANKKNKEQTEIEKKRIAATYAINESFFQGIMSIGWYSDIGAMFDNYMFSEEVMIALFHYCQEKNALTKKYVHAVAEGWYKAGVKSFEDLEDYFENYDKIQKIKQKIVKNLKLNRNLTTYEEKYVDTWIKDYGYGIDIIEEALKRTVNICNPTISYINGIISNWHKKGVKTVEDVEQKETKKTVTTTKKTVPKTKYQSYEQRTYDDLESFYDNV